MLPTEDRARLTIQMAPERQVKDLFPRLALEGKVIACFITPIHTPFNRLDSPYKHIM